MTIPASTAFESIRSLGQKLRAGEFTAVQLAEFFLERLERLGPKFNAVVTVTRKLALEQAANADRELAAGRDRGPLHGIPFGVKDLLATKDAPTTWGAAPFKEQQFDFDATVVVRLRAAGGILAAKLAMVEIAGGMGYRQPNAAFTGPGLNPWNPTRWSGGSSSGPGSAVGAGLVPFAIGSETWGSIMTPAAYCGIAGLRPTYGRVSRHGAMALSWTMDKLGPMCRTADDCGLVLHAIAGPDSNDPTASARSYRYPPEEMPKRPFRLATLEDAVDHVQPEIRTNFEKSLEALGDVAEFQEIELPNLPYNSVSSTLIACEMASAFEDMVDDGAVWELTAEEDRWGAYSALMIPAKDYIRALRIRGKIQQALDALFTECDAIVTPTLATVAGPIGDGFRDWQRGFRSTNIGGAGNAAGLPALTIPNGFGLDDLPTGLQFVGRAFEENRLLAIANAYQDRTDHHRQVPEV